MNQYQVSLTEQGIVSIQGNKGRVIRIQREDWQHLLSNLTDNHKGIYILYGRGTYYVGQGVFKQRLTEHLTNTDKHFSRIYVCMHTGTYEEVQEFNHYLLDIEGAMDRYLTGLKLTRMNKDTTSQQELLAHHQELLEDWLNLIHVLDPTFRDPHTQQLVIGHTKQTGEVNTRVAELTDEFDLQLEQDAQGFEDLNPYIKTIQDYLERPSLVSKSTLQQAIYYSGLAKIDDEGNITVKPYLQISVQEGQLYLDDVFKQYTLQELDTVKHIITTNSMGLLTKQKGVSIKIYRKLEQAGHIHKHPLERHTYYLSDDWLDTLLMLNT